LYPAAQNPKVTADRAFNGFGTNYEGSPEPIYGQLFLPRKFKIAVTGEQRNRSSLPCCAAELVWSEVWCLTGRMAQLQVGL
jgi:hypothetical protein